jgi:hypothetical protein
MSDDAIKIGDGATPALDALSDALGGDLSPLLRVLGRSGANHTQAWYRQQNSEHPNQLGAKRTNFWNDVADSVFAHDQTQTSVKVGIGHTAINQKIEGGTISAKRGTYLTIPISAEAYEHPSPALNYWDGRGRAFWKRPNGMLVGTVDQVGGGKSRVTWQWWYTPEITQDPTPYALPEPSGMQADLDRTRDSFIARKLAQIAQTKSVTE